MQFNEFHEKRGLYPLPVLFFKRMHHDLLMIIGVYGFLALVIFALFADVIAPYDLMQKPAAPLLPSAWSDVGDIDYFFGTDNLGRDILSRIIYGTKSTFGSSLIIMAIVGLIGTMVGIGAGINRGLRSACLNHVFDVFLSIPSLVLVIVVVVFIGPSLENAILAISFSFLPRFIHTISTAVRDELDKEYIIALRLDGASTWYILKDSIIPNITLVLISEYTRILSMAILDISALGFLGLGAQSLKPEWGAMLRDMIDLFFINPSMLILPGMAILTSVLFVNLFGNGIQRALSEGEL
jgi:cationic peptide transport system permease protein